MWSQRESRLSTITELKVFSSEKQDIALGEGLILSEASIAACDKGECASNVPGSESMVANRIVCIGTWENHIVPKLEASNKPKSRMWEIHKSGCVRDVEVPLHGRTL